MFGFGRRRFAAHPVSGIPFTACGVARDGLATRPGRATRNRVSREARRRGKPPTQRPALGRLNPLGRIFFGGSPRHSAVHAGAWPASWVAARRSQARFATPHPHVRVAPDGRFAVWFGAFHIVRALLREGTAGAACGDSGRPNEAIGLGGRSLRNCFKAYNIWSAPQNSLSAQTSHVSDNP